MERGYNMHEQLVLHRIFSKNGQTAHQSGSSIACRYNVLDQVLALSLSQEVWAFDTTEVSIVQHSIHQLD
jgi:hypothetical protein